MSLRIQYSVTKHKAEYKVSCFVGFALTNGKISIELTS